METGLLICVSLVALALAFWAGITFRNVRQERMNQITDAAFAEMAKRQRQIGEEVERIKTALSFKSKA